MADENGNQPTSGPDPRKAKVFFDRGQAVAAAGQFDYAIEMYLQGLGFDPDNAEAHQTLREISLKRKVAGGKDLGMLQKMKFRYGKDAKENTLIAERFLAYDPGNTSRMLELAQYAMEAELHETALWVGPILMRANQESGKPEAGKFLALKDIYVQLRQWQRAADAVQGALQLRPDDMALRDTLKNLAAQQTMTAGGYGQGGSFSKSVKDMDEQQRLMAGDKDIRTLDALAIAIKQARDELAKDPNEPGKLSKLVDALMKTEDLEHENEAMQLLEDAYKRTNQFRYRLRVGQIKMQQLKRMERSLRQQVAANPNDVEVRNTYKEFVRDKTQEELKEFALAAENYPTDIVYKFEMARRHVLLGNQIEAIPLLQQATQDPKLRVEATIELGRAFMEADYDDEAVDTMKGLTEAYQVQGDERAKEIYYVYGRTLEKKGDTPDAIKCYSTVARWDFNYKDVQQRIKRLRSAAQS